ncbi:hypothetical protein BN2476_330061 [Paraburkholderia piptadeniae]|uniref:Uncharacterized protein n=1 Tax=Paraburkholderia piptadeniae TaxID=1701573 RepID=A0A1N7S6C2_9BURK|nr:hypothetical protein BN2476_330061 [Paraburkholderia piptadeniae]
MGNRREVRGADLAPTHAHNICCRQNIHINGWQVRAISMHYMRIARPKWSKYPKNMGIRQSATFTPPYSITWHAKLKRVLPHYAGD